MTDLIAFAFVAGILVGVLLDQTLIAWAAHAWYLRHVRARLDGR